MNFAQVALSVIMPGFGHVLSGRVAKGVVLWALFLLPVVAGAARAVVLDSNPGDDALFWCSLVAAGAVWAHAVVDAIDFTYGLGPQPDPEQVDDLLRVGMTHLMRDELGPALGVFRRAAKMARRDPFVQVNLATLYALTGQVRAAARALRRCERLDEEGKWTDDVEALAASLARLRAAREQGPNAPSPCE